MAHMEEHNILRERRVVLGLTQKQVAEKANIPLLGCIACITSVNIILNRAYTVNAIMCISRSTLQLHYAQPRKSC